MDFGTLRELEEAGRRVEAIEKALHPDSRSPSPFLPSEVDAGASALSLDPPVDHKLAWVRLLCDWWDRERVTVALPDDSTYVMTQQQAVSYLAKMGHPKPEDFVALVVNFYDAIWFVEDGSYHRVSEKDRRRWQWERLI